MLLDWPHVLLLKSMARRVPWLVGFSIHANEATYLSIDIFSINFTEGLKQLGSNLSMYRSVEVKRKLDI